ncbi:MAG: UpxY family transcription antiterminator [Candidatus Neomarinimicrobiota bacterium]
MGNNADKVWLAAYTKSRHEKKAHDQLSKKGIESYLPLVKRRQQWKDRKQWVWMPLFRSYIFVHIPLTHTLDVLQTHGVHHLVRFNNQYAVIPGEQIEAVRRILEGGYTPDSHDYLEIGQEAEIAAGPLRGIRGVLFRKGRGSKFVLRIDGIRQAISVEIAADLLKKL